MYIPKLQRTNIAAAKDKISREVIIRSQLPGPKRISKDRSQNCVEQPERRCGGATDRA
jgi:hypothetical protein